MTSNTNEEIKIINDISNMKTRSDQRFIDNSDWSSEENIKSLSSILKRSMYFQPQLDLWDENSRIIFEKQTRPETGIQLAQCINNNTKMVHHILDSFKNIYNCDDCTNELRKFTLQINTSDFKNYIEPFLAFILLCLTNSYRRARVELKCQKTLDLNFVFKPTHGKYNLYYIENIPFSKFMNGLEGISQVLNSLKRYGLHFSDPIEIDESIRLKCVISFDCSTECKMKRNNVSK